jgi:hypothetical protein
MVYVFCVEGQLSRVRKWLKLSHLDSVSQHGMTGNSARGLTVLFEAGILITGAPLSLTLSHLGERGLSVFFVGRVK